MVKKSLVWLYSAATYLLWAVIVIVAVIVLGLRYYVFPHITDYKEKIAAIASQGAGQKITIGDIQAHWDGLNPYLDLYQVDIFDRQGKSALNLGHIETSLSWLSLPLAEPHLEKLVIHQPNLLIHRTQDGALYIAGIAVNDKDTSEPTIPNWLLRQSSIDVDNATVIWQDDLRKAPPLALNNLSLRISTPPWETLLGHHRFGLRATPSAGASAPLNIRGNLWGKNLGKPEEWRGSIYAKLEGMDIAAWRNWIDYPFELSQGSGAARFWLDFANGRADKVTADVRLSGVRTRFGHNMPEAGLQSLSGRLTWKRLNNGNEFLGERLQLATTDGFKLNSGKLLVASREINGKETMEGNASLDEIDLEPFATFIGYLPLGKDIQQKLYDLAPKGKLQQVQFDWNGAPETPKQYHIRSRFAGLGISSAQGVPGFSGLSGTLEANEGSGNINIDARNALLDLKGVLRWPIPAETLTGQVNWKHNNGVEEVKVSNLALASQHLRGSLNASYRYDGKKGGYLDLNGKFGNADGKYAHYYYPLVLSTDTLEWLDTSILKGHGENIEVVIKGYLDDFPYPNNKNGEFKVSAKITEGVLDYADGWPKIDDIQLDMLFHGDRMDLNVTQGRIYGGQIVRAKVDIPALDADHPILEIQGEVQAPAGDAIKYVNTSPISETIDHFTDNMQASGNCKLLLDLRIPIDNPEATRVRGSCQVSNGNITDPDIPTLGHVNGKLEFTESSLRAQNVSADIYGGSGIFNLETGKDGALRVLARGRITAEGIRTIVDQPLLQKVHGTIGWNGEVNLRNHLSDVVVHSQLVGLSSTLPPPFDKGQAEIVPFRFERRQLSDIQEVMTITYGNIASTKLLSTERNGVLTIERGAVSLGGMPLELPEQRGIVVNGKIASVDWDQWSNILTKTGDANIDGGTELNAINLSIGVLDVFGRRINNLDVAAKAVADGWQASLQSRETTGELNWRSQGNGKVTARLKTLIFPGPAPAKISEPTEQSKPDDYPALDIVAENFEHGQKKLGRLDLLASQQGGNWSIEKLKISNPESTLTMDGDWHNWKRNPNSKLNFTWEIGDLGKTLERFGYPDMVKGGAGNLNGQLKWPGSPHQFDAATLSGNLQVDAHKGQFLKIKPGVGRLLGILSLQSLPRRLLFDFRDVFDEGFGFDKISATTRIDKGIMRTDDFRMEGPSAKVAISGETDLDRETQNLHIRVIPSISDSLSLAALAGGPAVGAAAFIAQKLLSDPINKLAAYEYDIIGTWDDPQEAKTEKRKPDKSLPGNVPGFK